MVPFFLAVRLIRCSSVTESTSVDQSLGNLNRHLVAKLWSKKLTRLRTELLAVTSFSASLNYDMQENR